MSAEESKAIVRQFWGVWGEGNIGLVDELLAPDYVNHSTAAPDQPEAPATPVESPPPAEPVPDPPEAPGAAVPPEDEPPPPSASV